MYPWIWRAATDELYGLAPTEFTAARNAKAAAARKAGLADVAAALKELRKPSVGAWLANLLVRERSKEIESLIALGDGLREPGGTEGAMRSGRSPSRGSTPPPR